MAVRKSASLPVVTLGRQWVARGSLLMLATAGVAVFVMGKSGNPSVERLRTQLMDVTTPVIAAAASPFDAFHSVTSWFGEMAALRQENIALKNQNRELLKWQAAAKDMQAENESLKQLLNVVPSQSRSYVTARLVSDMSGPYMHSALINGGVESGVKKNQAVINEDGLVGRTIDVGQTSARVLLLSDINSRVPVTIESSREKSILAGNNEALPVLSYVAASSQVVVGDRIVTSGDGGVFPAGIPVGVVTSVDKAKGDIRVQPFADVSTAEHISIVNYSF